MNSHMFFPLPRLITRRFACFAGSHPFCMLVLAVPLVHLCCLNAPSLCWSNDHFCWSRNQGRILDGCISTLLPNAPVFYGIIYIYHWVQIMSHDSMAFMFAILPFCLKHELNRPRFTIFVLFSQRVASVASRHSSQTPTARNSACCAQRCGGWLIEVWGWRRSAASVWWLGFGMI